MKKTYIYADPLGADRQIIAQHDGEMSDDKYFYLHDRLGSVRLVIDDDGDVVSHYTYEPFGEVIEDDGTFENAFRFTGQFFDPEIEEYYLRARQYNPQIARFTSRDPIAGKLMEPLTLHKYLYCNNDPINWVDLTGNSPVWVQYEFWVEVGKEVAKGAAATLDGLNPVPFWNPLEGYYANEDGSIDSRYKGSRLLGSGARTALSMALNAYAIDALLSTTQGGVAGATIAERLVIGACWKGALFNQAGTAMGLTWGASSAILGVAGVADNILDFLAVLE